jgi:DNA-binding transcriptional LysR family regulator
MELRHLRYFVVVAEEQNVTRAAERLHVSQPPLSRQIHDLEQELGVELFRRTAKSLALTEAGKIFLIEARAVLLRVDKAVETVRTVAHGDRGSLRIGYAPSLTAEFLPRALRLFENDRPGVRVALHDLSSEECAQRLAARKLDLALAVRLSAAQMRGLTFEKLIAYPMCCAVGASHPLAKKRFIALDHIRRERFMVYSRQDYPEYYENLAGLFKGKPFSPCQVEEHDGATGLIAAVEAGRGVALVSTSMRCMAGPRLHLLPLKPALEPITVGALVPMPMTPMAEKFLVALRQAVKGA